MAFNRNTGRQYACKIVDLQAVRSDLKTQARESQADSGEKQQSKFFAKQPRPVKYTATTGKSSLLKKAILDKITTQERESILLAELSHVSVFPIPLQIPGI
jgi:hypothetical protein